MKDIDLLKLNLNNNKGIHMKCNKLKIGTRKKKTMKRFTSMIAVTSLLIAGAASAWEATPGNVKRNRWCPICSRKPNKNNVL